MVMRYQPANIRVIHRRCRSADQITGSEKMTVAANSAPRPDGLISRARGYEVLSNRRSMFYPEN